MYKAAPDKGSVVAQEVTGGIVMEGLNVLDSIKVLYVEDEVITRSYVAGLLKKRVGKLITAESGADGIKKFLEDKPDIIITDLVMPDMSGIEMMKKIRTDGYRCPFIITSALSDYKIILQTVDLKIEKYLLKPIDEVVLIKSLIDIATLELEQKSNSLVINHELILNDTKKTELELDIRNIYSAYLKRVIGKGARQIQVLIKGREIEIIIKDNLTTLEESLLLSGNHYKSIEVIRKTIYENTLKEVIEEIGLLINRKISVESLELNPKDKYERVLLNIL